MAAAIAIALKDLRVFLESWRAIALTLLLPAVLVLFVGQLRTLPTTFRVVLAGDGAGAKPQMNAMASLLAESSLFDVETSRAPVVNLLAALRDDQIDLLCIFDGGEVRAYSGVTDPFRAALLARAVENIREARVKVGTWVVKGERTPAAFITISGILNTAIGVIVRSTGSTDYRGDAAAIRKALPVWSKLEASLAGRDLRSARESVSFIAQQVEGVLTSLSLARAAQDDVSKRRLEADVIVLRAALEVMRQVRARSEATTAAIAALKEAFEPLGRAVDALAAKLPAYGAAELASTVARVNAELDKVPSGFIDFDWLQRLKVAAERTQNALQPRPDGSRDQVQIDEIVREGRELVRLAGSGQAIASPIPFPTLLDAITAPGREPSLTLLYPMVAERPRALLPEIIALVMCFLPFVLAVQSLLREREEHTVEILLSTGRTTHASLFVGKLGLPIICTLFNFALIVVLVQLFHGLFVKPGIAAMILVLLPAVASSALFGLAASVWVRSGAQATIVCAIYFLAVTLFSGFLYPIASQDPRSVVALWSISPLTFVHPSMKAWMFGAQVPLLRPLTGLLAHCVIYAAIAVFAYRQWLRSI